MLQLLNIMLLQKYGERMKENSENKISTERCATLMGIAIANKIREVWISKPLVLQLVYLRMYYPNLGTWYVTSFVALFLHTRTIILFHIPGYYKCWDQDSFNVCEMTVQRLNKRSEYLIYLLYFYMNCKLFLLLFGWLFFV